MKRLNVRIEGKDEWLTPPALVRSLGEFDLDPCAPINRPWDTAKNHFSILDNGLLKDWFGRVWLNPPYGQQTILWMNRLAMHANGIALIFARTETKIFHRFVFPFADSLFFLKGRLTFLNVDGSPGNGNAGGPSVLIAYGQENSSAIAESGLAGAHLPVNHIHLIVVGMSETWRAIVECVLVRLNEPSSLQTIYDHVERVAGDKVRNNVNYKAKIRQVVQQHFKRVTKGVWTK